MTEPSTAAVPRDPGLQPTAAVTVVLALLHGYKILFSPLFTGSCRFDPSCAAYMADAVRIHGAVAGVRLGLRRLARCHPWGGFGFDPVPLRGDGAGAAELRSFQEH